MCFSALRRTRTGRWTEDSEAVSALFTRPDFSAVFPLRKKPCCSSGPACFWGRLLYRLFKVGLEKRRYLLFASSGAAKSLVSAAFFTERERPTETACTKGALFSAGPERSRISFAKEPFAEEVVFPVDGQNSLCYVISKVAKGLFFLREKPGKRRCSGRTPARTAGAD